MTKRLCVLCAVMALLLATMPAAYSQSMTSSVTGTVADETGGVIAGATAELTNLLTQQVRTTTTGANGRFLFSNVLAGDYDLHIEVPGFTSYDQRGISVSSAATIALGNISLSVGEVTTSIEVSAEAARVQTENSDRSETINENTIESLPLIGRDYRGILNTLPGNIQTDARDAPGWGGGGIPVINGGQIGTFLVTLDGVASQDSGWPASQYSAPSVDAIGEVKVMVSNYNAEYGARSAGTMNVTMKSGTADFHGSLYHYWRHESLNANDWFNNRNSTAKPRYRYQNPGGTIGGPVIIPGTSFNESRTRLFFFYSEEHLPFKVPGTVTQINMPTAAEHSGDFSNSFTEDGIPLSTLIKDPTTGQLFDGGVIPQSRTTPMGRAVMDLLPLPMAGVTDPTGRNQYNWEQQYINERKRSDRILRVDFGLGTSTTSYVRLMRGYEEQESFRGFLGSSGQWDQFKNYYKIPTKGISWTVVHTLTPTVINETTFGINRAHQQVGASDPEAFALQNELQNFKDPVTGQLINVPHVFEGANDLNLIPNINFSANGAQAAGNGLWGSGTVSFGFNNRWPFNGTDQMTSIINNLSWVKNDHNFKFGFYTERMARNVSVYAQYNTAGTYWFGTDSANTLDTGWPLSNALLGTVQAYGEDNRRQINHARYTQVEWFAQDTWKVTPRLSLDLGMRFQIMQPNYSTGATLGFFQPDAYSDSATGQLLFPACSNGSTTGCSSSLRIAVNPQTGQTYPYPRRSFFEPGSFSGTPFSGVVQYDSKYYETPGPVILSPRFGFAYDVFGDGSTAVRGGFGIFYDRTISVDDIGATGSGVGPMAAPPWFQAPLVYNTTFNDLRTALPWYTSQRVVGGVREFKAPTVYSWSFGIQQNVGWGTILDVAYVGNMGLHRVTSGVTNLNALPPGLTWTPAGMTWDEVNGPQGTGTVNRQLLDPTNNNALLNDNLIRALAGYNGWNDISWWDNRGGNSNYHSLQIQVNRQFGKDIQFGANYTWSRTHNYSPQTWINDDRLLYQQSSGSRPHVVNMNFGWTVPSTRQVVDNRFLTAATEGWNVSGVIGMFSGQPIGWSCSVQNAPIGYPTGRVGGGYPMRCDQVGPALLPDNTPPPAGIDERLWVPVNLAGVVLPRPETLGFGNATQWFGYGNGFFNFDMSVEKSFTVKENVSLVFRMDTFNFLNHFNPGNPGTNPQFRYNANGPETNTRTGIGEITSAQSDARKMALSARLRF